MVGKVESVWRVKGDRTGRGKRKDRRRSGGKLVVVGDERLVVAVELEGGVGEVPLVQRQEG